MRLLRAHTFVGEIEPGRLQVGSAPPRTVVFSSLSRAETAWIKSLSPTITSGQPQPRANVARNRKGSQQGRPRGSASENSLTARQKEMLVMLDAVGLLEDGHNPLADLRIRVSGLDRIGARVATLLAEEGVRELELRDRRAIEQVMPPAFTESHLGKIRQTVLARHLRGRYPGLRVAGQAMPDLVVVCSGSVWDHGTLGRLLSRDIPHLPVVQRDREVQVGPLIVPGVTGCALCADLSIQDSFPLWAKSSLALANAPQPLTPDHLCMTAAGLAVTLIHAAATGATPVGAPNPTGVGGVSYSLTVGSNGVETRAWHPHPGCSCRRGTMDTGVAQVA